MPSRWHADAKKAQCVLHALENKGFAAFQQQNIESQHKGAPAQVDGSRITDAGVANWKWLEVDVYRSVMERNKCYEPDSMGIPGCRLELQILRWTTSFDDTEFFETRIIALPEQATNPS